MIFNSFVCLSSFHPSSSYVNIVGWVILFCRVNGLSSTTESRPSPIAIQTACAVMTRHGWAEGSSVGSTVTCLRPTRVFIAGHLLWFDLEVGIGFARSLHKGTRYV